MSDSKRNINERVKELIDNGESVYSKALGRMGRIIGVNLNSLFPIQIKSKRGQICVTTFNSGDKVRIDKVNGRYYKRG